MTQRKTIVKKTIFFLQTQQSQYFQQCKNFANKLRFGKVTESSKVGISEQETVV